MKTNNTVNVKELHKFIKHSIVATINPSCTINISDVPDNYESGCRLVEERTRNLPTYVLVDEVGTKRELRVIFSDDIAAIGGASPAMAIPLLGFTLVAFNRQLLKLSDAERVAIIGHELGHIYHRHLSDDKTWHRLIVGIDSEMALDRVGFGVEQRSMADRFFTNEAAADDFGALLAGKRAMAKGLKRISHLAMGLSRTEVEERIKRLLGNKYVAVECGHDARIAIKMYVILGEEEYLARYKRLEAIYMAEYNEAITAAIIDGDNRACINAVNAFNARSRAILIGNA